MEWFLYDRDLRHKRVNNLSELLSLLAFQSLLAFHHLFLIMLS